MNEPTDEAIESQKKQREEVVKKIINSKGLKKIVVAGPGTGKSYLFKVILQNQKPLGNNLALTFINKLAFEMEVKLSGLADAGTFHKYCKGVLHKKLGDFKLVPFLTKVIEKDSLLLDLNHSKFEEKLQKVEDGPEIKFFLHRGDYYKALGFNDTNFRLLRIFQNDPSSIKSYSQILIDEFQDFNPLEVGIIEALESKSSILLAGDDDQAIYSRRESSPNHLRSFYNRDDYEKFNLPFCGRCTQVIVESINKLASIAINNGNLKGRIIKNFECYYHSKLDDSRKFPKIITIQTSQITVVPKFIEKEIKTIELSEVKESNEGDDPYPTILVIGQKNHLKYVYDYLSTKFNNVEYNPSSQTTYTLFDGYELLMQDIDWNLGWRIVSEFKLSKKKVIKLVKRSQADGTRFKDMLDKNFIEKHEEVVEKLKKIVNKETIHEDDKRVVTDNIDLDFEKIERLLTKEQPSTKKNLDEPTILLTSFEGCKGLSAGRVFVLGLNNGDLPRNKNSIQDIEISKLIVALSRTRKCCYLISNKALENSLYSKEKSIFLEWIGRDLITDLGYKRSADI